jgi:hypothetical protein
VQCLTIAIALIISILGALGILDWSPHQKSQGRIFDTENILLLHKEWCCILLSLKIHVVICYHWLVVSQVSLVKSLLVLLNVRNIAKGSCIWNVEFEHPSMTCWAKERIPMALTHSLKTTAVTFISVGNNLLNRKLCTLISGTAVWVWDFFRHMAWSWPGSQTTVQLVWVSVLEDFFCRLSIVVVGRALWSKRVTRKRIINTYQDELHLRSDQLFCLLSFVSVVA